MVDVTMPPTIGAAMAFITSEQMPLSHRMGRGLTRVASSGLAAQREVSENGDSAAPALNLTITSGKLHLVRPAAAPTL